MYSEYHQTTKTTINNLCLTQQQLSVCWSPQRHQLPSLNLPCSLTGFVHTIMCLWVSFNHTCDDKWPECGQWLKLYRTQSHTYTQFSTSSALHVGPDICSHGNSINRGPTRVRKPLPLSLSPFCTNPDIWSSLSLCTCSSPNIPDGIFSLSIDFSAPSLVGSCLFSSVSSMCIQEYGHMHMLVIFFSDSTKVDLHFALISHWPWYRWSPFKATLTLGQSSSDWLLPHLVFTSAACGHCLLCLPM